MLKAENPQDAYIAVQVYKALVEEAKTPQFVNTLLKGA